MPVVICPTCSLQLNIRPEQVGKPICCPMCNAFFTELEREKKSTRSSREEEDERPHRKSRYARDKDDEDDHDWRDDEDDREPRQESNLLAIFGLSLSVLGVVIGLGACLMGGCCPFLPLAGSLLGVLGAILSYMGLKGSSQLGLAKGGLITSIAAIVIGILAMLFWVLYFSFVVNDAIKNPPRGGAAPLPGFPGVGPGRPK